MNLSEIKPGLKVKTNQTLGETTGMLIKQKHLDARRPDAKGVVRRYVPSHGGDVWFVAHGNAPDGSEIGAYCFDEFELAGTAAEEKIEEIKEHLKIADEFKDNWEQLVLNDVPWLIQVLESCLTEVHGLSTLLDCVLESKEKWEKACKEWLKGCTCSSPSRQEACTECTKAFHNHLRKLATDDRYEEAKDNAK